MPITQSRMLDLVSAATDLESTVLRLCERAKQIRQFTIDPAILEAQIDSAEPRADLIHLLLSAFEELVDEIRFPQGAIYVVAKERAHFAARAKSNDAAKRWQQDRRHRPIEGVEP